MSLYENKNAQNSIYKYKYNKYKNKYNSLIKQLNIHDPSMILYGSGPSLARDEAKILDIAKNVKILGVAEATHGQNEITKFRMKLFKNLVKKCGYTVFIVEDQYSCSERINQYIQTGKGNLFDLMMQLRWFWRSIEMFKLIKWMRKYNKENNNVLEFHGIDVQSICLAYDPTDDPVAKFVEKKCNQNLKVDQSSWVKADAFRDKSMFEVFMQLYDPSKKYYIHAHNYHICKRDMIGSGVIQPNTLSEGRYIKKGDKVMWMGCRLAKEFGDDYYAIGNAFTDGGFLETFDIIGQNKEAGIITPFEKIKGEKIFIIVKSFPRVAGIDTFALPNGLYIFRENENENSKEFFDAIMSIKYETPLELISMENPT